LSAIDQITQALIEDIALVGTTQKQIAFISTTVENYQMLVAGVIPGIQTVVLDPQRDGVEQITELLSNSSGVEAIHIISHGTPGSLDLGGTQLSLDTLDRYASQLQQWDVPSLLLYGCNVAVGDAGEEFVEKLHQLTGSGVAASRREIGDGYWSLEFSSTATTIPAPFHETVLTTWTGRLAPTVSNLNNSSYNEQDPAYVVANGITFSGGTNYGGGSIEFSLSSPTTDDFLTLVDDGTPVSTLGQISVVGNTVYMGNGTNGSIVGFVDPLKNGQNGQNLRIQFTNQFQNGNFSTGTTGSGTIPGWTTVNNQVKFGPGNTIAGLPTPTDTTTPANATNSDQNTAANPGTMTSTLSSVTNGGTGNSVQLKSTGITTAVGFDVVRGPYIYTNDAVSLSAGDTVSFEWQAQGGGDAYDVYGYLVDVTTGNTLPILDQTGSSGSSSTTWATETVTVPQAGAYKFIFVSGTFDFSGGGVAGAQLFIDNVVVTQAIPTPIVNDADISALAQKVKYNNTSDNPAPSQTLTVTAEDNTLATGGATATINITYVNDAPSFTASNPTAVNQNAGAQTLATWATFSPGGGTDEATQTATYTVSNISNAALFATAPAIDASGNLTYTPATTASGTSTFDLVVQDSGGTANGGVDTSTIQTFTITVVDTTAPAAPAITTAAGTTNDNTPTVTGTAEANSTVNILEGTTVLGTATADASGNWTFTPTTALTDGTYSITATATDAAGNTSTPSTAVSLTVDATLPTTPTITTASGATNDSTPDITGTAEANSTVNILEGTTVLGTVTADASGNWTFTPTTALSDGTYSLTATATDTSGNTSTASTAVSLTVDTIAPTVPTITTASGTTSDSTPDITGTAEANSTVEILQGTTVLGTATADASGKWTFTPTTALTDGTYSITATATDAAGNTSTPSTAVSLTVDATASTTPTINTPSGATNDSTPDITGTAEAGSTVNILQGTTVLGTATADASGNWTFTPTTPFTDGTYTNFLKSCYRYSL
jgi:plastocyanin